MVHQVLAARRDGKGRMLGSALDFARDDKARWDILSKFYPNATRRQDKAGNYIVAIPQDDGATVEGYMNRPGLSVQDINEAITQGLIEAPLALMLRRFGPFGVGTGTGAGSVVTDLVAQSEGSDQPIDWTTAALGFGLGAVGREHLERHRVALAIQVARFGELVIDGGGQLALCPRHGGFVRVAVCGGGNGHG